MLDRMQLRRMVPALAALAFGAGCDQPARPGPTVDLLGPTAALAVAATTTGPDIDPDGYTARLDKSATQHVDPNGLVTFSGAADGDHRVDLYAVAENCWSVGNDPRTVTVTAGIGATRFDVGCVAEGSLYVADSTTGVDLDPDGYTVTVDGTAGETIGTNGSAWFNGVSSYGGHSLALSGLAPNCTVSGANPRAFAISSGVTTAVRFDISCVPLGSGSGTLTVTTSTTGSNLDPNGYAVTVDGTSSQVIGTNGTASVTVAAGAHPVALSGIAANCGVSGDNPRTVSVPAGGRGATTFAVACSAAMPPVEVQGAGQLKMGAPVNGNFVQTFALDVRADGTGRFTFTDWSDIHPSGQAGTIVTDPAADPATSFTVRTSSSACPDPSRGIEFDAVGREDDGTLRNYTVELCDNGAPGSGTDFVSLYIPYEQYGRSGTLTSGDITKKP